MKGKVSFEDEKKEPPKDEQGKKQSEHGERNESCGTRKRFLNVRSSEQKQQTNGNHTEVIGNLERNIPASEKQLDDLKKVSPGTSRSKTKIDALQKVIDDMKAESQREKKNNKLTEWNKRLDKEKTRSEVEGK